MALADLLQWADHAAFGGLLTVRQDDAQTVLVLSERQVVEVSEPPAAAAAVRDLAPGGGAWPLPPELEARERLIDLFLEDEGAFELLPGGRTTPGALGVPMELDLRVVVLEGMRARDEWPAVAAAYPDKRARLSRLAADAPPDLDAAADALLSCAEDGRTLAEARLALGYTSPALLRLVHLLRSMKLVDVEGVSGEANPVAQLLRQVLSLMREQQYAEAAHVVESMLASDPGDTSLRELLARIREEQTAALYEELPRAKVPRVLEQPSARIPETDQHVLQLADGARSVADIVSRSALREVETLKALSRLLGRGLLV